MANPLLDPPPASVDLPKAPLHKVIIQLRFSDVLGIENRSRVEAFQEAIRTEYPILRPTAGFEMTFSADGALSQSAQGSMKQIELWYFKDLKDEWTVVLAPNHLTLETKHYENRSDFLNRFQRLLNALMANFGPITGTRLGVRYIDRIGTEGIDQLHHLIRPEMLGIQANAMKENVHLAVSEAMLSAPVENAFIRARWGLLPANVTFDPTAIDGLPHPSWVLDQDMFREVNFALNSTEEVLDDIRAFSIRMYAMFRWIVTKEFLRLYGGNLS